MKRFLLFTAILLLSVVNGFSPTVQVTSGGSVTAPAKLAIGISSIGVPATSLEVAETGTGTPRGILSGQYNTGTDGARVGLRKARGTRASPTTIVTGDELGGIHAWGYDSANYLDMAGIDFVSSGTIAATRVPTEMRFYTASDALPSVKTLRLTLDKAGLATFTAGLTLSAGNLTIPAGDNFVISTRGLIGATSDGVFLFRNVAGTDLNRINLGGTTASFPAIKRNGAGIDFRTGDDGGYASITAQNIVVANTLTVNGPTDEPAGGLQTLAANSAISTTTTTLKVVGNGGAVTLISTPTIADSNNGRTIRIFGTSDANAVTLQDEGTLPGSNLQLGAATRVLGLGDILVLYYDGTTTQWFEQSFTDN